MMFTLRAAAIGGCLCLSLAVAMPASGADVKEWLVEPVSFQSTDGVQLSGSFVTPRNEAMVAVVVLGPGAIPGERYEALAALMTRGGIAVLTYDKRGSGRSGGAPGHAGDVGSTNLRLFANDAAAAMKWVSSNPRVRSLPRGYVAISQSGWVIPMALAQSPKVDFIGFWSGPTCTTSEQLHYERFSDAHNHDRSLMTDEQIREVMKHVRYLPDDVDPLKALKDVSIPGLWLFGGQDSYVPIELSTQRLRDLIDSGRANFQYAVYPNEGHNLADSPKQRSFMVMIEWIRGMAVQKH